MAGAGRKSAYRKSVTEDVLNSFPEPDIAAGERIAQVVQSRGGNILQVLLPTATDADQDSLAILPTKFRKLIWVKRGDFVIVSGASHDFLTAAGEKGKVKYMVEHILYKDQVKHLKKEGMWPEAFADKEVEEEEGEVKGGNNEEKERIGKEKKEKEKKTGEEEGGESGEEGYDSESSEEDYSDLHVNTNRMANMHMFVDDDDDDEDDEEDEDDDDEDEEEEEER